MFSLRDGPKSMSSPVQMKQLENVLRIGGVDEIYPFPTRQNSPYVDQISLEWEVYHVMCHAQSPVVPSRRLIYNISALSRQRLLWQQTSWHWKQSVLCNGPRVPRPLSIEPHWLKWTQTETHGIQGAMWLGEGFQTISSVCFGSDTTVLLLGYQLLS